MGSDDEINDRIRFHGNEEFLKEAISVLPLKKMGLAHTDDDNSILCKQGTFDCIELKPEKQAIHSIWVPRGATNTHSTEDYQGFTYKGKDYFVYRRPDHHVKKIISYDR